MEFFLIIISAIFVNNIMLAQFLGTCPFLGVSNKAKTSFGMGGAVIFVITIASAVASLLYDYVLKPLGLDFMKTIIFILVMGYVPIVSTWLGL